MGMCSGLLALSMTMSPSVVHLCDLNMVYISLSCPIFMLLDIYQVEFTGYWSLTMLGLVVKFNTVT